MRARPSTSALESIPRRRRSVHVVGRSNRSAPRAVLHRQGSSLLAAPMLLQDDLVELLSRVLGQIGAATVDYTDQVFDPLVDIHLLGRRIGFRHGMDGAAHDLRPRNAMSASKLVELAASVRVESHG